MNKIHQSRAPFTFFLINHHSNNQSTKKKKNDLIIINRLAELAGWLTVGDIYLDINTNVIFKQNKKKSIGIFSFFFNKTLAHTQTHTQILSTNDIYPKEKKVI